MTADEIRSLVNQCAERTKSTPNPIAAAATFQFTTLMIHSEIAVRLIEIAEHLAALSYTQAVVTGIKPRAVEEAESLITKAL